MEQFSIKSEIVKLYSSRPEPTFTWKRFSGIEYQESKLPPSHLVSGISGNDMYSSTTRHGWNIKHGKLEFKWLLPLELVEVLVEEPEQSPEEGKNPELMNLTEILND